MRTCDVLQSHSTGFITGLCKVNNQLITAGEGIGIEGNTLIKGNFSCIKYFDEIEMLCAGDRNGNLNVIRIY